jgi:4-hydroxyphenylpyruvate dioxygenase-like putative hemolysin
MKKEKVYDPKIDELLSKFEGSREELLKYLSSLDSIKTNVESIFPQNIDFRNKFVLEEKLKTLSSFYSTMLNVRQEYNRTLKDEIMLRQKSIVENDDEKDIDYRIVAEEVEKIQKEKK